MPLLSYQKSEQLGDTKLHTISKIQTKMLYHREALSVPTAFFMEQ